VVDVKEIQSSLVWPTVDKMTTMVQQFDSVYWLDNDALLKERLAEILLSALDQGISQRLADAPSSTKPTIGYEQSAKHGLVHSTKAGIIDDQSCKPANQSRVDPSKSSMNPDVVNPRDIMLRFICNSPPFQV
jgi:hypothetical protein